MSVNECAHVYVICKKKKKKQLVVFWIVIMVGILYHNKRYQIFLSVFYFDDDLPHSNFTTICKTKRQRRWRQQQQLSCWLRGIEKICTFVKCSARLSKHNFAQKQEAKIQQQNDRLVICVYVTEPI